MVIVQNDQCDGTTSVSVCAFTTDPTETPLLRIRIESGARDWHRLSGSRACRSPEPGVIGGASVGGQLGVSQGLLARDSAPMPAERGPCRNLTQRSAHAGEGMW